MSLDNSAGQEVRASLATAAEVAEKDCSSSMGMLRDGCLTLIML